MIFQFIIQTVFAGCALTLTYFICKMINSIIYQYKTTEKLRREILLRENGYKLK